MSVVRIPRPEEDRFPLARALAGAATGASLGLAIAYGGMERDRANEDPVEIVDLGEGGSGRESGSEGSAGGGEGGSRGASEAGNGSESGSESESGSGSESGTAVESGSGTETGSGTAHPDPATGAPAIAQPAAGPHGPVTLRPGRVAYLRCEGLSQRPGPFPCPRDPPLEAAVWQALAALDPCPLAPGAADVVIDIGADGAATIRVRDTFPPDVVRADGAAILACAGESLQSVRSSLGPERLVVSFRLTLAAAER